MPDDRDRLRVLHSGDSASVAARVRAQERRAQVLRLRLAGVPFDQIGQQLDPPVTRQRAHQLYRDALAQIVREPAEEVVKADLERLDMLWRALIARALAGSARHAEVGIRVLERRAKMLGLDAPTRTEVLTLDAIDAEIRQLEAELARRAAGGAAGGAAAAADAAD
jgi:hypothetical protein